jgi:hypothetical protein
MPRSYGHGVNEEPRNLGLSFVNAIGNTGHRWVAALAVAGVPPQRWPVAIADENGPTAGVFASSITTWLPCYVVHLAGVYAAAALAARPPGWLDAEAEQLIADEPLLREALAPFAGDVLTPVLDLLRRRGTLSPADWRPGELYAIADAGGCVAAYHGGADPAGLIRRYPWYNRPLFDRFAAAPDPDLAHEVFLRRLLPDGDGTAEILDRAAAVLLAGRRDRGAEIAAPIEPLVRRVAQEGAEEGDLAEWYFEAGTRWEAAGAPARALACYDNAVHRHGLDEDDWHAPALARIRALTAGDADYAHYLDAFTPAG